MEIRKDEILKNVQDKDDKILISNILDKYKKYDKTGISIYSNFLDIRKFNMITNILKRLKIPFNIYKPAEECEKSIIYFGDYDNFVTIYKINIKNINHKDVLGTLFSLGYDQDTIGDIFVEKDYTYITNLTRLNAFLETNLYTIKNNRVKLEITNDIHLSDDRFIDLKIIIPSYRLDVIISKLAHMSRSDASKYIEDKMVLVNMQEITNTNKIVNTGDIISIRKIGKFIIDEEILKSKKDNHIINIKKYN